MAALQEDDFEFEAVPKFMDFQNDENDGTLLDRSAFFAGNRLIHPTPHKPAAAELFNEPAKAKTTPPPSQQLEKNPAPFEEDEEKKRQPLGATSNLALFNPGASRLKERARRRSQQIQVQEDPKPSAPKVSTRQSVLVNVAAQRIQPFTRSREAAERKNLEEAAKKLPLSRAREVPASPSAAARAAEQKKLEEKRKQAFGSNSNLALFNPAASRVQERVRRRSQQIQVKEDPKPAPRNVLRRPVPSTPPKNQQPFGRSRELGPRILSSVERLSMPKNRQGFNAASAAGTPQKAAQPISRLQRASTNAPPPKLTPDKPEAFKNKLRSYKPSTGKTPAKGLTVPKPYPFHRSRSQCRDTDAKPLGMDPKIRESVNRLSAPKKRESASNLRRK